MGLLRKRTILLIMFLAFSMGMLINGTLANFETNITGEETVKNTFIGNLDNITIDYLDEGYFDIDSSVTPGSNIIKKVLVTNSSLTTEKKLSIVLSDLINNFNDKSKLTYTIDCEVYANYYDNLQVSDETCLGESNLTGTVPSDINEIYKFKIKENRSYLITITINTANDYTLSSGETFFSYITMRETSMLLPLGNYLRINDLLVSESTTNSVNVTLYTSANSASHMMCFSNTDDNTSCTWIPYTTNGVTWTLTGGVGTKTVYVWFKDISGNVSTSLNANIFYTTTIIVDLENGMVPIKWSGSAWVVADPTNQDNTYSWYDYCQSTYSAETDYNASCEFKWANMALVIENGTKTRETYLSSAYGTIVADADILAQFVYIPRYKYQLWNASNSNSTPQEIKEIFENISTIKSSGSTNGDWLTHPAFTFGEAELNGIWVGKFETSAETASTCYTTPNATNCDKKTGITPRIKGNVDSWRYATVSTYYDINQMFKNNSIYGIVDTLVDSHMMKNIEWGAVSYLYHSKYGKYGNSNYIGANKELYINNYNKNSTTYNKLTGCSAGAPSTAEATSCANEYPSVSLAATGASTTGTIYGIYDMNGGSWEYVMGNMVNNSGAFYASNAGTFTNANPLAKYYDNYAYDLSSNVTHNRGKLGDATRETLKTYGNALGSWYSDSAYFVYETLAWFIRGGRSVGVENAGIFAFNNSSGSANNGNSSRAILTK